LTIALAISCGAGLSTAALPALAASSVDVPNFNFEAIPLGDGKLGSFQIPGWTFAGASVSYGTYNPGTSYYANPAIADPPNSGAIGTMSGPRVAYIFDANGTGASVTTRTQHVVAAGETYLLTVAIGQRNATQQAFGRVTLSLWDDDSLLATGNVATAPAPGSFGDASLRYTAQAADAGRLRLQLSVPAGTNYADFDNVRLSVTAVPEPATAGLMMLGLAVVASRRRGCSRTGVPSTV
jgi:hypothetical protein